MLTNHSLRNAVVLLFANWAFLKASAASPWLTPEEFSTAALAVNCTCVQLQDWRAYATLAYASCAMKVCLLLMPLCLL